MNEIDDCPLHFWVQCGVTDRETGKLRYKKCFRALFQLETVNESQIGCFLKTEFALAAAEQECTMK